MRVRLVIYQQVVVGLAVALNGNAQKGLMLMDAFHQPREMKVRLLALLLQHPVNRPITHAHQQQGKPCQQQQQLVQSE